jgi:hypothetical protein
MRFVPFRFRVSAWSLLATMGYDKDVFISEVPAVDGYECVICQDVVEDAVLCEQGHTCARRGACKLASNRSTWR